MPPRARDILRRYLVADQAHRDALAERLLRERTATGDLLAEIVDRLTLNPEERRRWARGLGELEAWPDPTG
jgi:hypothetical protein